MLESHSGDNCGRIGRSDNNRQVRPEGPGEQVLYLQQELELNADQSGQVSRILATDRQLAQLQRDQYRDTPKELSGAAKTRVTGTLAEIAGALGASQKDQFDRLFGDDDLGDEASRLSGRLALDAVQTMRANMLLSNSPIARFRENMRGQGGGRGERRGQMQEMRSAMDELDKKIEQLLTDEQKDEYKKLRAERRERIKQDRDRMRDGTGMGGRNGWR